MQNKNSTFNNLKYRYRFFFTLDYLLKKIGINFTKVYVYSINLDNIAFKEPMNNDIVIKQCTTDDLHLFGKLKDLFLSDMQKGHVLIAAFLDDQWVGYTWISFKNKEVDEIEKVIHYKGAYLWRNHVEKEYRQRGIAKRMVHFSLNLIKNKYKKNEAHVIMDMSNVPSIKTYESNGFKKVGIVNFSRFFLWKKYEENIDNDSIALLEN